MGAASSEVKDNYSVITLDDLGHTFRLEDGHWVSYPTNSDGTCDFCPGTAVYVEEWEEATSAEIDAVLIRLRLLSLSLKRSKNAS